MANRSLFGGWLQPGIPIFQRNRRFYGTFDWKQRKKNRYRDNPVSVATGLFKPRASRYRRHELKMERRGYRRRS